MTHKEFMDTCIHEVETHVHDHENVEVFTVWSCKTLQNSKCILADNKTGNLYEFTMNGDTWEIYVDIYKKDDNYKLDII